MTTCYAVIQLSVYAHYSVQWAKLAWYASSRAVVLLTFRAENWHTAFSYPGKLLDQFWFFCVFLFCSWEPLRVKQADWRVRPVMQLVRTAA